MCSAAAGSVRLERSTKPALSGFSMALKINALSCHFTNRNVFTCRLNRP